MRTATVHKFPQFSADPEPINALTMHGSRNVTGRLDLRLHSDFDQVIQVLTIMRDLVKQPEQDDQRNGLVQGGSDAARALTPE